MPATPNILVITSDVKLHDEVENALAPVPEPQPVTHYVPDLRQGLDAVRGRRPELVIVEMIADLRAIKTFAGEVAAISPETTVAAVFRQDVFAEQDLSESAILIEALRAGVKDFLRRPISTADLAQLVDRTRPQPARRAANEGVLLSFISNKGGVGKSTLSVNVACGLAQRFPDRVLLVDASLQLGTCASLLDLQPATSLTDAVRERNRLDETLVRQLAVRHDSGLHLLAAPADAVEAAEVDDEIICRVLSLARRTYDFVVVDTFPLLDRVVLAVLDLSERAYVVTENVVPTLLGAANLFKLLDSLGFPRERQRLVINRYTSLPGSLKALEVAERLDRQVDHVLAFDKRLIITANTGEPFVLRSTPFSSFGRELRRLIDDAVQLGRRGAALAARNGAATAELAGLSAPSEQGEPDTSSHTSTTTAPAASAAGPFPSRHFK